ncbi:hypothetical protein [Kitasatospora sp. NPDC007106]|uniref:hypothetical protein n=1 Tax=Kitasatospora sp. NPDC007106 TaxID=3156914 RepID=UPI0033D5CF0C
MPAPFDHRLVQTGVIGNKGSDKPIILPMEAHELERWRKQHPTYTYWCGLQLGGCGRQLADRLYRDKVCHFAHHPNPDGSPVVCHRTANGEDSADHLFIKQGVERWLRRNRLAGKATLRNLGTGPGDAVEVHLPRSRQRLRFQLSGIDYRAWRRAEEELSDDADGIDWIFAQSGPITREMLGRFGYTLRVRCETDGAVRRVYLGTERPSENVDWVPFEECTLSSAGLVTPRHAQEPGPTGVVVLPARPRLRPAAFVLPSEAVFFVVDPDARVPQDSPLAADGRYLVAADVKPGDSRTVRALISLPRDVPVPAADHVYRFTRAIRLLVTEPDRRDAPQWLIEGTTFECLNAREAHRTGLSALLPTIRPPEAPVPAATTPEKHRPVAVVAKTPDRAPFVPAPAVPAPAVPVRKTPPSAPRKGGEPGRQTDRQQPSPKVALPVDGLRKALEDAAARGVHTTWGELAEVLPIDLSRLAITDRRKLLVAVDRGAARKQPLLSVLVRSPSGGPLPYLPLALTLLGMDPPSSVQGFAAFCDREAQRTFAAYAPRSQAPVAVVPPQAAAVPTVEEIQRLVTSAENGFQLLRGGSRRRLATTAISRARNWLRSVDGTKPSRRSDHHRHEEARQCVDLLSQVVVEAEAARTAAPTNRPTTVAAPPVPPQGSGRSVLPPRTAPDLPPADTPDAEERQGPVDGRLPADRLDRIAEVVREILIKTARNRSTVTWSSIRHQLGPLLPSLHTDDQGEILVRTDRATPVDEPLLSALVVVGDHEMHPLYRHVAYSLDRDPPPSDDELRTQWAMDVLSVHTHWRHR